MKQVSKHSRDFNDIEGRNSCFQNFGWSRESHREKSFKIALDLSTQIGSVFPPQNFGEIKRRFDVQISSMSCKRLEKAQYPRFESSEQYLHAQTHINR